MAIFLTNDELNILTNIDHTCGILYVVSIRPRMDLDTGLVGKKRKYSFSQISDDLKINTHGKNRNYLHKRVNRLFKRLEKSGLITIIKNKNDNVILLCCEAELKSSKGKIN